MDACAFALVPFLVLVAVGAALSNLGVELWWLPHRNLGGRGVYLAARVGAAFGWSIILFSLMVLEVRKRSDAAPAADDRPAV